MTPLRSESQGLCPVRQIPPNLEATLPLPHCREVGRGVYGPGTSRGGEAERDNHTLELSWRVSRLKNRGEQKERVSDEKFSGLTVRQGQEREACLRLPDACPTHILSHTRTRPLSWALTPTPTHTLVSLTMDLELAPSLVPREL
jgi:hypothetical protein